MKRGAFLLALLGGLGVASRGAAEVVPLAELEKRALEHHVSMLASQARERAAQAGVREAVSNFMPRVGVQVDSNLQPGRNIYQVNALNSDGPILVQGINAIDPNASNDVKADQRRRALKPVFRTTALLQLTSTLYDFGRTAAGVAVSRARLEATRAENEVSRREVVALVRAAYLTWLSSVELHRIAAEASVDGSQRSERVSALISEGARPRGDLAPVEADRLLSQLELERAIADMEEARMALEYVVGEPLSSSAEPDLGLLELQVAREGATRPDPSLRLLVFQRAVLEATARLQRKAAMPAFTAGLGAGVGVQQPLRYLPSYQVGVGLSVPIWDGGGSRASAQATDARVDELRLRLEDAEAERNQEQAKAALQAEHALKRRSTAEQLIEVCSARVSDTETGYAMGAMQFDQVQQARSMLRRAQTELVMAKVAHTEALLRTAP